MVMLMIKNTFEAHNYIRECKLPFIFHNVVHKLKSPGTNWHENTEFLFCYDGNGTVFCDSKELSFSKGDTIIINSKQIHRVVWDDVLNYFCLIIDNSFFKENGINIESLNFDEKIHDSKICELMSNINDAYNNSGSEYYVAENRAALCMFMTYITKNYSYKINAATNTSKSYLAIVNAIDYVNKHYSEKISIDILCEVTGYSKYHFARIFKESTGTTVIEHINAIRCEKAKNMLLDTSKTILQISNECGFEYPSYFTKTFKTYYQCMPSEFRKKYSKLK